MESSVLGPAVRCSELWNMLSWTHSNAAGQEHGPSRSVCSIVRLTRASLISNEYEGHQECPKHACGNRDVCCMKRPGNVHDSRSRWSCPQVRHQCCAMLLGMDMACSCLTTLKYRGTVVLTVQLERPGTSNRSVTLLPDSCQQQRCTAASALGWLLLGAPPARMELNSCISRQLGAPPPPSPGCGSLVGCVCPSSRSACPVPACPYASRVPLKPSRTHCSAS
jgi:hypothetical protein